MNTLDWGFAASAAVPEHNVPPVPPVPPVPTWPTDTTIRSIVLVGDSITSANVSSATASSGTVTSGVATFTLTAAITSYKQHMPVAITGASPANANISTRALSLPDSTHLVVALPVPDGDVQPLISTGIRLGNAISTPAQFWGYAAMRAATPPPLLAIDAIGNTRIEEMIARFEPVAQYKPSHIHFLGGSVNNYGGQTAKDIADLIKQYCELCRAKGIQVLCASILPRGILAPTEPTYAAILVSQQRAKEANALVKAYAEATPGITYVDYWPALCDPASPDKFGRAEYYNLDHLTLLGMGHNAMGKVLAELLDTCAAGALSGTNRMPNAGFTSVADVPSSTGWLTGSRPATYYPSRSSGAGLTCIVGVKSGVMSLTISGAASTDSLSFSIAVEDLNGVVLAEDSNLHIDFKVKVKGPHPVEVRLVHGLSINGIAAPMAPTTWSGIVYPTDTFMRTPSRGYRLKAGETVSLTSVTWYFLFPKEQGEIEVTEPRLWLSPAAGL